MSRPSAPATTGCYPGTFDPPTVAHLAVAEAAVEQCGLDRLDVVISHDAIGKPAPSLSVAERVERLGRLFADEPRVSVRTTERRLLVDIARDYDVLVLGADKWLQVLDAAFYSDPRARDEAVASLPLVACAPRAGFDMPDPVAGRLVALHVDEEFHPVSSSSVRAGAERWEARPRPVRRPDAE